MSGKFFEALKNLFPHARAFELFADNTKYKFVRALSELPEDIRLEAEKVYLDLFPHTTRFPEKWESVFALFFTGYEMEKRRDIIDAMWKLICGNQAAGFLEYILRFVDIGFHVDDNVPVIDPRSSQGGPLDICDYRTMVCDNEYAMCDLSVGDSNFVPTVLQNDTSGLYDIPEDVDFWRMCFFIGKEIVSGSGGEIIYIDPLPLDIRWKSIVEYLVLKIKPVHTTALLFVDWKETHAEVKV